MSSSPQDRRWFWVTLILSSVTIVAGVFAIFELVENHYFREADYLTLHYLYISRGIGSALLLAVWAAWFVLHQRLRSEEELRRSHERYRGLLEASPGAVILFDSSLAVWEWNASAEHLYGYAKSEVVGRFLPTIPPERRAELEAFLGRVGAGEEILDVETLRQDKRGTTIEVQLSLLPFRESSGQSYFLEVTADIRERARMRQKLLEIEKLTSMGQMAAGTAHHLNTPLAAMLLRIQMMRERFHEPACGADLERLESGLRFCQSFVQRLLQFSRQVPCQQQPEEIGPLLQSVLSFLAPPVLAKRAHVSVDVSGANGERVSADRNQLEALFSVLMTNALDAIPAEGRIVVRCHRVPPNWIEIQFADNGCGIPPSELPHIFEPFFTTKGAGKGTGLGLAIARNIVREHGGTISLESIRGQGTIASVRLPRLAASTTGQRNPS